MNKILYNNAGGPAPPANLDSSIPQREARLTLTVEEMAQQLHISRATAYKLSRDRNFYPAFRVGQRVLVGVQALERWLHEQTEGKHDA